MGKHKPESKGHNHAVFQTCSRRCPRFKGIPVVKPENLEEFMKAQAQKMINEGPMVGVAQS